MDQDHDAVISQIESIERYQRCCIYLVICGLGLSLILSVAGNHYCEWLSWKDFIISGALVMTTIYIATGASYIVSSAAIDGSRSAYAAGVVAIVCIGLFDFLIVSAVGLNYAVLTVALSIPGSLSVWVYMALKQDEVLKNLYTGYADILATEGLHIGNSRRAH
ncbi:hypothetical protein [Marinobacterium sp. BA1]|uniref:hypothetical protein n=1 Tax=Marinobacterium sp. BA1 TaxID=3138931 RepID=UPI0032E7B467